MRIVIVARSSRPIVAIGIGKISIITIAHTSSRQEYSASVLHELPLLWREGLMCTIELSTIIRMEARFELYTQRQSPIVRQEDKTIDRIDLRNTFQLVGIFARIQQVVPLVSSQRTPSVGLIISNCVRTPIHELACIVTIIGRCVHTPWLLCGLIAAPTK